MSLRIKNALQEFGLSETEAQVYILLLRLGKTGAGTIAKELDFPRATTYQILERLLDKGVALKTDRGNVLSYSAEEPEHLLSLLRKKEEDIDKQKNIIKTILPDLLLLKNPSKAVPKINYVEGINGYFDLLQMALESNSKIMNVISSSLHVRETIEDEVKLESILRYESGEFIKRRVATGVFMRFLTQDSELSRKMKQRDILEKRETRFLPSSF